VRSLVRRSAQAAKEIKHLIGQIVDKVDNGAKLVEESAAAADSRKRQAQCLTQTVSVFKIATV
jgi:methyl-accepting chemotaxis protein